MSTCELPGYSKGGISENPLNRCNKPKEPTNRTGHFRKILVTERGHIQEKLRIMLRIWFDITYNFIPMNRYHCIVF